MDMSPSALPTGPKDGTTVAKAPVTYDEMIEGFGVVTVVENFRAGEDRLLLDFEFGLLPKLSFDSAVEPGSTAVMGDDRLMVILRGADGIALEDVELNELPGPVAVDQLPGIEVIEQFDPDDDVIEVLYDAKDNQHPSISVRDFEDKTGAVIYFDEQPILAVRGAQGLSPQDVVLVPREA